MSSTELWEQRELEALRYSDILKAFQLICSDELSAHLSDYHDLTLQRSFNSRKLDCR
jgi:hypothetical protein